METLYQNSHAVVGLKNLYARLKGELKRIDCESGKLAAKDKLRLNALAVERECRAKQLEHVATTLQLLSPAIELEGIRTILTRPRVAHLPHGKLRKEILIVLRKLDDWVTAANLHAVIIQRNGITFSDPADSSLKCNSVMTQV